MDYAACHVVYVDSRISRGLDGKHVQKAMSASDGATNSQESSWEDKHPECFKAILGELEEVRTSLKNILSVFNGVHVYSSGNSCLDRVNKLEHQSGDQPTMLFLAVPGDEDVEGSMSKSRESSQTSDFLELQGYSLLQHVCSEVSSSSLSKRVVPIATIYQTTENETLGTSPPNRSGSRPSSGNFTASKFAKPNTSSPRRPMGKRGATDLRRALRCVDSGAVEVLPSPLQEDRLQGLVAHAYRAHKEALRERAEWLQKKKMRKLSWLGNNDKRPYAYLREKMVSELMTGICNPDEYLHMIDVKRLPRLDPSREAQLKHTIGSWNYSGHDYTDDELVYAACFMLQHALTLPELDKWRMSESEILTFLMASRAAYNSFVNYHNFRHVIDVMQAIFFFLIQLGVLAPYPDYLTPTSQQRDVSPIAALLKPFDALTLLITAIGHDVGHPGVNNAFLVSLNAPLAQLYNDKSVLEAFHCAAYSQILRRYWPATFKDKSMRGLMINSILATDMGVHMKYMSDLGSLQERLHHNQGTDGWNPQTLDEYRVLICALLVKCADISNVARPFNVALKWADSLQLEFANQGIIEQEVGIATTLFGGPPELGNLIKLGNSQNSFINIFAHPLFEAVTDVLPAMGFAVQEMIVNQSIWTSKIKKEEDEQNSRGKQSSEGWLSPRSMSPSRPASDHPETSHPEGLPAGNSPPAPPGMQPFASPHESPDNRRKSSSSINHQTSVAAFDGSRRSSGAGPLNYITSTSESAMSVSRRSSGTKSTTNAQRHDSTARKTSNTSPSQVQFRPDSRSQSHPSTTNSENTQPNGHASDDTLSQTQFYDANTTNAGDRRNSDQTGGGGGSNASRKGSKGSGSDNMRSGQGSTSQASGRPYGHSGRHRSSSGAHTTNTNLSQSMPYSPTGTQATSVLTIDSDGKSSPSRTNACNSPDRTGMPKSTVAGPRFGNWQTMDGSQDTEVKTSVIASGNGSVKEGSNNSYRSIGRKTSRFNFNMSNIFKKRRGIEASP